MHNSAAPQTSLFTGTLHMFLLQFNTTRIFDRQACYSCKFPHTHRSDTHFQHSLLLGCFYLGDLFLPLAALNSQLPWHWIKIERIFTPSWWFPSRRSCAVLDKALLEQLGRPKIPPYLFSCKHRIPSVIAFPAETDKEGAGSKDNKFLWVHGWWDPFSQLFSFSEGTSGQHPRNSEGCTYITHCHVHWRFGAGGWS